MHTGTPSSPSIVQHPEVSRFLKLSSGPFRVKKRASPGPKQVQTSFEGHPISENSSVTIYVRTVPSSGEDFSSAPIRELP